MRRRHLRLMAPVALAVTLIFAGSASAAGWRVTHIGINGGEFDAISCGRAKLCVATGKSGVIATHKRRWKHIGASPAGGAVCEAAGCQIVFDSSPGFRAAEWGKDKWRNETATAPIQRDYSAWGPVSCSALSNCLAVGASDLSTHVGCPQGDGFPGCVADRALAEQWNGKRWIPVGGIPVPVAAKRPAVPVPSSAPGAAFSAVSCESALRCTIFGTWFDDGLATLFGDTWHTGRWNLLALPLSANGTAAVSLSCASPQACVLLTAVSAARTVAGDASSLIGSGDNWRVAPPAIPDGTRHLRLFSVDCRRADWCLAVGDTVSLSGAMRPLAETWNGREWLLTQIATPPQAAQRGGARLTGVSCTAVRVCTAVGDYGQTDPVTGWAQSWYVESET